MPAGATTLTVLTRLAGAKEGKLALEIVFGSPDGARTTLGAACSSWKLSANGKGDPIWLMARQGDVE